jgi:site-specific DNA recombinase
MVKQTETNKSKLRAVGYIRVSSKDQVEGYSLDFQTEAIQDYCKNKYDLKKLYSEEGISGKTVSKRDAFQQMVSDGYAGKFDVVIVWKFDRFTRDIETGVASFFGLKNHGIKIISLQEGLTSDSDNMMTLLSIGMADKYRKDLIANIKRGTKTKLKSGDPNIGMAGQPIARYWDEKDKIFRLKEDEAAEWREAAKQYRAGVSVDEIAKLSKKRGSKTIPTTGVNVRRHLRTGLGDKHIIHYDGEIFEFSCEPIVDKKTEQAVIDLMDKRKCAPNVKPDKFLLMGHIFCANCGKKLTSLSRTKKLHRRYVHQDRKDCNAVKTIRVDYIDEAVLKECFLVFGGDKKAYEKAIKEHLPDAKARKEIESDINSLKRQLAKYERDKELILDKVLNQNLNSSIIDGLNQRAEQIEKNVEQSRDELCQKEQRLASMLTVEEYKAKAKKVHSFWQKAYTGWGAMEEMNWKNKKYLIDLMFDGIDENGRPYGVYVKNIGGKVFEYEIYGRFTEGSRFMKNNDYDYDGTETEPIEAEWERDLQAKKAAHRSKSKSYDLKMGDTGLEPVTSCV